MKSRSPIEIGMRFGRWTIISKAEPDRRSKARWNCRCDCGNTRQLYAFNLQNRHTKSCGCLHRNPISIIPGMRFDHLTVINQTTPSPSRKSRWECQCDCGNLTKVHAYDLQSGRTKSCGCLRKENASKLFAKDITGQRFGRLVA